MELLVLHIFRGGLLHPGIKLLKIRSCRPSPRSEILSSAAYICTKLQLLGVCLKSGVRPVYHSWRSNLIVNALCEYLRSRPDAPIWKQ